MLNTFRKFKAALIRLLEGVVALIMAVLVLDVLWQILARMFPTVSSFWTEELATVLLIWLVLLGACVAFDRKQHLGVDYFVGKLPRAGRRTLEMVVHACTALFAVGVLIYGGGEVVRLVLMNKQPLPALGIQMGYVYLALPISGVLILLITIENLFEAAAGPATEEKEEQA